MDNTRQAYYVIVKATEPINMGKMFLMQEGSPRCRRVHDGELTGTFTDVASDLIQGLPNVIVYNHTTFGKLAEPANPRSGDVEACATCGGTGIIDEGDITHVGSIAFENGPVKCFIECPDCDTEAKLRETWTQKPVAWMNPNEGFVRDAFIWSEDPACSPEHSVPVYKFPK